MRGSIELHRVSDEHLEALLQGSLGAISNPAASKTAIVISLQVDSIVRELQQARIHLAAAVVHVPVRHAPDCPQLPCTCGATRKALTAKGCFDEDTIRQAELGPEGNG